jgi:hypothetical protein
MIRIGDKPVRVVDKESVEFKLLGRGLADWEENRTISDEFVEQLTLLGFEKSHAEIALKITGNSFDHALEMILSDFKNDKVKLVEQSKRIVGVRNFQHDDYDNDDENEDDVIEEEHGEEGNEDIQSQKQQSQKSSAEKKDGDDPDGPEQAASKHVPVVVLSAHEIAAQKAKAAEELKQKEIEIAKILSDGLLHKAVWLQDTERLSHYLKLGLGEEQDHYGNTPLNLAFALGHYNLVNFLFARGVDPRKPTAKGVWTAVHINMRLQFIHFYLYI